MMKSLVHDIVRTTQQAALAAWPLLGCGDKNQIDGVAVAAMRQHLGSMAMRGQIVIGEGEIDRAPMLYIGENLGTGQGPAVDIAVDPIEGTRMVAMGQYNALAVIAFAPRNTLLHAPDMYMRKMVVGAGAKGAIDLSLPLEQNLRQVAAALGKPLDQLRMITLDKPRHECIRQQAQALGVKVFAIPDGDVAASLMTCLPAGEADIMYTLGGAPEGVISACAVRLLGGDMQAELIDFCQAKGDTPQHRVLAQEERRRCESMGIAVNTILPLNTLIASDEVIFSATGITKGDIVGGIKQKEGYLSTETLMINGTDGSCNRIQTLHLH